MAYHVNYFKRTLSNFAKFSKRTQRTSSLIHSTLEKLKCLKERNLATLEAANLKNPLGFLSTLRFSERKSQSFAKLFIQTSLKKAQMKIQQMAFVLVALMLLFAIIGIIYITISLGSIRETAAQLGDDEARELVVKLTSTPEFAFTSETCSNCVDLDKVFQMKNRASYKELWNLEFLKIEKVYPSSKEVECEKSNYPDCSKITIMDKKDFGSPSSAFVSLCHWEQQGGYIKCEIGKIYASGKDLK